MNINQQKAEEANKILESKGYAPISVGSTHYMDTIIELFKKLPEKEEVLEVGATYVDEDGDHVEIVATFKSVDGDDLFVWQCCHWVGIVNSEGVEEAGHVSIPKPFKRVNTQPQEKA